MITKLRDYIWNKDNEEYLAREKYSPYALQQARNIVKYWTIDKAKHREFVEWISIDAKESKDLDDAIWAEKYSNWYKVWIHISDPTENIKKYSPYPEKVKLVAVTKYSSVEDIEKFLETGQIICGENKVQVIKDKIEYFKEKNKKIKWHFIGNLQKNKVKYIIDDVDLIHSVNKLSLAQEINKKAEQSSKIMDVLLEINVYGEESKQGYSLDELKCDIIELQNLKNLNIIGVMTMAPFTDDEKILRMVFSELRKIKDELNEKYFNGNLTELSMGMSNDYKIALQEGSTYIRVGTKIFK